MQNVDFYIGALHFTYGNLPALVLFVFALIKLVLGYFFIHDVSKQQRSFQQDHQLDESQSTETPENSASYLQRAKRIFFIHDASEQQDRSETSNQPKEIIPTQGGQVRTGCFHRAKMIFGVDGLVVLVQTFWVGSLVSLVCRLPPLMMTSLKMSDLVMDVCYMGISVATIIVSLVIKRMRPSDVGVYNCGVASLLGMLPNSLDYQLSTLF